MESLKSKGQTKEIVLRDKTKEVTCSRMRQPQKGRRCRATAALVHSLRDRI